MLGIDGPTIINYGLAGAVTVWLTSPIWYRLASPACSVCRSMVCLARRVAANTVTIRKLQSDIRTSGAEQARGIDQNKVILNRLGVAVMEADAKGGVVWVSDPWCDLADAQRDQSLGSGWLDYILSSFQDAVAERWFTAVKHDRPASIDINFGRTGWRGVAQLSPIRHLGEVVGWRAIVVPGKVA